ncbi:monovalent cation/H+ antiporter subunit D family protein [Dietzia lutea]|uniref:Cation:proton antiporter n=1 Tax=Dietzia lutea TaxID=546160 RepID=A0A2S1R9N8_9ACTN|nr:monovalent cation/H+ antiporter subunit D family protein [Dietzia lutea]AWH93010.1 cation:proton antiporter [Dietzia lutea]
MTGILLPLVVVAPMLSGVTGVLVRDRRIVSAWLLLVTSVLMLVVGIGLTAAVARQGVIVHEVGLWPAGIAIPLVADMFSSLMITTSALVILMCAVFAVASGESARPMFAPFLLILSAGTYGALLTGDIFNLFVFIEVMLMPSYALLAMFEPQREPAAGRLFLITNLLASMLLLCGVALVYGSAETTNLGVLAGAARESPDVAIGAGVILVALSLKASVVPMHGWLAQTYPFTSPAITAVFSGLHTKVAIYAIYRIYAVVFDGDERFLTLLLVVMTATMVIGVLAALGQNRGRSILSFHMVSQIGYILLGVALFGELGLAAGIFYMIHNIVVKTSLFLTVGAVETRYGTDDIRLVTGLARTESAAAIAFVVAALSLAGLPPSSGFVAKFLIVSAAVEEHRYLVAGIAVAVSLFTLLSMMKIWNGMFWRSERHEPEGEKNEPVRVETRISGALVAPGLTLALVTIGLGLGAQFLLSLSGTAASGLVDTGAYVGAVTGR